VFGYLSGLKSLNDFDLRSRFHISQNNFPDDLNIKSPILVKFAKLCAVYLSEKYSVIYMGSLHFVIKILYTQRDWSICLTIFIIHKCPAHDNPIPHSVELCLHVFVHLNYYKRIIAN
jgi:hypothetical protein